VYVSVWARVRVEEVARRARRLILWSFNIVQCWFGRSFDWLVDWMVGSSLCAKDVAEDHSKRSVVVGSAASLSDLGGGASREMDDREGAVSVGILQIGLPPPKFRLCRRGISTNAFSGL
jgi:hypothetical protein